MNNLIGQIRNLLLEKLSVFPQGLSGNQFVKYIVPQLKLIENNIYDMVNIPRFKTLSVQIINKDVWKVDFNNLILNLGFHYRRWCHFKISDEKQRINQMLQLGWLPKSPTIKLQGNKIFLQLPFERVKIANAALIHPNLVLGVDLGLKHYAVVSIWDKDHDTELARYFLGVREIFDKKFVGGKIISQSKRNNGAKTTNILAKFIGLRKQVKIIQSKISRYETRLQQNSITDFSTKLK